MGIVALGRWKRVHILRLTRSGGRIHILVIGQEKELGAEMGSESPGWEHGFGHSVLADDADADEVSKNSTRRGKARQGR